MNYSVQETIQKADKLNDLGRHDDAINLFSKLIQSGHSEAKIFAQRGYSKFKAKYYKKAIDDFSKAIDLKDDVPTTYFFRARSKEEIGDLNGALEDYKKSAMLDAKIDVHINMGMIYEYLGDFQQAENEYLIVLEEDPNNKIAVEGLKELSNRRFK